MKNKIKYNKYDQYCNGSKTKYEYNANNFRLTNLKTVRGSDILQNISYIYDPEGNITEINDTAQQNIYFNNSVIEPKSLYEYDALYRLKKATGREHNSLANLTENDFINNIIRPEDGQNMRNFTQEYKYDQIGNLLQMKSNGVWTRDYMYDFATNNHLLKHDENATINSYEYDAHGNMTKMPHLPEMKYDYDDQLNEVTLNASGNKAYYIYDASGERVRKIIEKGNIKEERFYVGDYEVYKKTTNGTLNVERETLHINDDKQKVALIDNDGTTTTIRYQYTNHLDSASLELDHNAEIISYEEYHPFGTTSYRSGRNEIDVSLKRYKYVHKELDNETGLYYYGMRYYAPWIARFISVDPIAEERTWVTPYNYVQNNPINRIDPDGALDDEWTIDINTGEKTRINTHGGKETQFVNFVYEDPEIGGQVSIGKTHVVEGSEFHVGRTAKGWGVSAHNFWEGLSEDYNKNSKGYNGEKHIYTVEDLKMREVYLNSDIFKYHVQELETSGIAEPFGHDDWVNFHGVSYANKFRFEAGLSLSLPLVSSPAGQKQITPRKFNFTASYNTKHFRVDQYTLKAVDKGFFPIMKRGFEEPQGGIWLKRGDVWKYGTTKNPMTRYTLKYLKNTGSGLEYKREFSGFSNQSLRMEKMKILNYKLINETLPPGNKIVK